jgi:hypothetical protein
MNDQDAELARLRAIPEGWAYRVIRSSRNPKGSKPWLIDTVMQTGILGCSTARAEAARLQAEYDREHPGISNWVKDLFVIELEHEGPPEEVPTTICCGCTNC